ncbi:hypothetical protein AAVH_43475, partial [Aphelenchoides avenae]
DDDFDATAALAARVSSSNLGIASFSNGRETSVQRKGREGKEERTLAEQQLAEKLFGLSVDYAPSRTREADSSGSEDELGKLLGPSFGGLVFDASTSKDDLRLLAEKIGAQFNRRSSHRLYTTFTMQLMRALCEHMSKGELEVVWGDIDAAIGKKSAKANEGATCKDVGDVPSDNSQQAGGTKRPDEDKNAESSV